MPFGMVSGVGRGMGELAGMVIVEWEEVVLRVNFGRGTDAMKGGNALFPNYFGED